MKELLMFTCNFLVNVLWSFLQIMVMTKFYAWLDDIFEIFFIPSISYMIRLGLVFRKWNRRCFTLQKRMTKEQFFITSKLNRYCQTPVNFNPCLAWRSKRRGFQRYIVGQLKECAVQFFKQDIAVRVQDDISSNECTLNKRFHFIHSNIEDFHS